MSLRLQAAAEALGQALPALLAEAEFLAASLMPGGHGRRRAGSGDEFWQYRAAHPGDTARSIDWRRSARSDGHFIREREWQAAQSVTLWVDPSRSMDFSGSANRVSKGERARLLALALAVLLLRGAERVGLSGPERPRAGRAQLLRLASALGNASDGSDYGVPQSEGMDSHGRAVFFSDFLGPLEGLEATLGRASDRGVKGIFCQILDPAEEEFPFDGRVIFESMGGGLRHETQQASGLRSRYLGKLAERKDRLAALARASGWQICSHHTGAPAQMALLTLYHGLQGGR